MLEKIQFSYVLIAMLGMLIHKLQMVIEKSKNTRGFQFSIVQFFTDKMNWIRIVLSTAVVFALMLVADDAGQILGITLKDGSTAKTFMYLLIGYFNVSLFRTILKIFKKRIDSAN